MYLIPQPKKMTAGEGSFCIRFESYIVAESSCRELVSEQAGIFKKELGEELGFPLLLTRGKGRTGDIILRQDKEDGDESYILVISQDNVLLTGGGAGLWHGLQTLLQIVSQSGAVLPAVTVEDAPDMPNRGFYHDITRGRIPKLSYLKKLADRMAYYKLNQLQLYIEHSYLFRDQSEVWRDDTPLTAEDILELDRYCKKRGIELVPSLSSFGHLYKLLSTRSYSHLCELQDADKMPFSLRGRMHHHTINVTDSDSLELIKSMIAEFLPLFTSGQFNICADETFDLGKGKSKAAADEKGVDRIYIDFVKALCEFLVENGKRPMFWGDIICGFPELIKELPEETVCLNWGYAREQRVEETKLLHDAGATQYNCPGVCGWNHFLPLIEDSYENIRRMCSYATQFQAIGVLNTDWGDFLHINHPSFSVAGMIYGATFSWNASVIPTFEEMNRQISAVEYLDATESLVGVAAEAAKQSAFEWETAIRFMELDRVEEFREDHRIYLEEHLSQIEDVDEKNRKLVQAEAAMYALSRRMDVRKREELKAYLVAMEGIRLFNELGMTVTGRAYGKQFAQGLPDAWELASKLENWLYHYKEVYRQVSRESELGRIQEVVIWYADYLRQVNKGERA